MAFDKNKFYSTLERVTQDKQSYNDFISSFCLQKNKQINNFNECEKMMALTPPKSLINNMIEIMRKETDFPGPIAFFGTLHYISGYLLSKDIYINLDNQKIYPDIWTIILAPSGSGKSSVESFLNKIFADRVKKVEPFSTSKSFVQNLAKTPKGLLVKDEWAQLLSGMEKQTYPSELKEYLLKTYDNADIHRTTGKEDLVAENPAISIFGSTVDETFTKYITEEMLRDGFAQRFNYVYCLERPLTDKKPILKHFSHIDELKYEFIRIINSIKHKEYKLSEQAISKYEQLFYQNLNQFEEAIPYSFFRRTSFKTIKYALIYHVLLKKENNIIDEEDIIWADRVTYSHFIDLTKLFNRYDKEDCFSVLEKAYNKKEEFKEKNLVLTPRDMTRYLKTYVKSIA